MIGICRLYNEESELQESHIFPKFVVNYTKKTGSKYLRSYIEPDKRMQDGIKKHLLSWKAEQDFSKREKWFAENIFRPHLSGNKVLKYDDNLYYFSISFLWRILISELESTKDIDKKWYYNLLIDAENEWREFLLTGKTPEKFNKVCLLLTDRVEYNPTELKGVDFYLTRIFDGTIVDNKPQTCLLMYGKFNKFIFWAVLKEYGDENTLHDVLINPNGGVINIPQNLEYFPICSFLGNRIQTVANMSLPNSEQQKKIEEELLRDKEFWEKELGKSLLNDLELDD
ncbi:hypothetical protein [Chryseobacterium arthrosphaerae]|uniref:hypothetical protein n=1 Tax=Chryseobacterium arthrosphaerae TaxID=651561 RepID=UPI001F4AFA97|nr:hypothetical protein [Chryseobacterium arthrosphaerae]